MRFEGKRTQYDAWVEKKVRDGGLDDVRRREERASVGPTELWTNTLPYVMTVVVLALVSASGARRRLGAPASLGLPYVREER